MAERLTPPTLPMIQALRQLVSMPGKTLRYERRRGGGPWRVYVGAFRDPAEHPTVIGSSCKTPTGQITGLVRRGLLADISTPGGEHETAVLTIQGREYLEALGVKPGQLLTEANLQK